MNDQTAATIRAILRADASMTGAERARIMTSLSSPPVPAGSPRLLRRAEVARRLGITTRTVDNLARSGALARRVFPGRVRGCGFCEAQVNDLVAGKADRHEPAN